MDLSISIVSYNTKDLIKRCVDSIYRNTRGISFETIVVDNGSKDSSVVMLKRTFPKVIVIANSKNVFFTKANNQALYIAQGRYFVILNSDTYFTDNSLRKMITYMETHKNIGACEGLEMHENGTIVKTGSRFSTPSVDFYELSLIGKRVKNRKVVDSYRYAKKDRRGTFPIDVGCDAFLMVRKEIMDKIGGYDERFLLYYTENDLCLRIKKQGYGIVHFGKAKVMHRVSSSVITLGWKRIDIYYQDLLLYYRKHGYSVSGTLLFLLLKCEEVLLKILR